MRLQVISGAALRFLRFTLLFLCVFALPMPAHAQGLTVFITPNSPTNYRVGQTVNYTANIGSPPPTCGDSSSTCAWTVMGGTAVPNGSECSVTWTTAGACFVKCTVTFGTCTGQSTVNGTVTDCGGGGGGGGGGACNFYSSASPNPACTGQSITFSALHR